MSIRHTNGPGRASDVRRVRPNALWHPFSQLFFGWLTAVVAPTFLYAYIADVSVTAPTHYVTTIGATLSLVAGVFSFRRLHIFPGLTAGGYVVMCISSTFAVMTVILILLRLDYSRILLLSIYFVSIAFFTVMHLIFDRRRKHVFGFIPGGQADRLPDLQNVEWLRLTDPNSTNFQIDGVVVDLRYDHADKWDNEITKFVLCGTPVYDVKQVIEQISGRVELEHLSENNLGSLNPNDVYLQIKQAADCVIAVAVLTLLSPLFLIISLLIKMDSSGPALFRQRRTGYRAKPFVAYKFRTMVNTPSTGDDVEEARRRVMTQANDPRVTRIGAFLRKTRLDELPQMLNVLKADMSLIGPRPEAVELTRWYEAEIALYHYRHIIKPGITGWAQVNQGHVSDVDDIREKLHLDFYYVKNFSFWLDLLIVIRTVRTMATGWGAR